MIRLLDKPTIELTRDVRPRYRDVPGIDATPQETERYHRNWGRPVGFDVSEAMRLEVRVRIEFDKESSETVNHVQEALARLLREAFEHEQDGHDGQALTCTV